MAHLQDVGVITHILLHVVVTDATSNDAEALLTTLLQTVVGTCLTCLRKFHLLAQQIHILLSCDAREEHPLIGAGVERFLFCQLAHLDSGTAVSQTGDDAQEHRLLQALRKFES